MSYINDALKRAQQNKDSRYSHYGGVISQAPERPARRAIMRISMVAAVLVLAAVLFWIAADQGSVRPTAGKKERPLQAGTGIAPAKTEAVPGTAPGKPPQTSGSTEKALAPLPDARALYMEALAAQRKGKTDAAEWLYRRVLAVDAQHVEAMNNLGVLYLGLGKTEQALDLFNRAIALKTDYAEAHYNLSCLYARQQNKDKSLKYLEAAIALNRDVIQWAKEDQDLKPITTSKAFRKRLEAKEE